MKIIISHDVDHLHPSEHIFRDLIFPKLWIRSTWHLIIGRISIKMWFFRLISIFDRRLNRIPEIMAFDKAHKIPSTFFFGMNRKLGMSYSKKAASKWMKIVLNESFDIGIHGTNFQEEEIMKKEYSDFKKISGINDFGIRMHYVQYNDDTFNKLSKCGYIFDTSEFNKQKIELKPAYKIGNMWEFPLHIMDGYIMFDNLKEAKEKTIEILNQAEHYNIKYLTFLFHDYMYNEKTYPNDKMYYEWFVKYCIEKNYIFVSYKQAIEQQENE